MNASTFLHLIAPKTPAPPVFWVENPIHHHHHHHQMKLYWVCLRIRFRLSIENGPYQNKTRAPLKTSKFTTFIILLVTVTNSNDFTNSVTNRMGELLLVGLPASYSSVLINGRTNILHTVPQQLPIQTSISLTWSKINGHFGRALLLWGAHLVSDCVR